jgi:hypothetical protein
MCSVSWIILPDGYRLVFNRDERHARKPAFPPALYEAHGIQWISPADGDFGGTWLAVNQQALSLGLVNYYPETAPPLPSAKKSRGFIIPSLIHHPGASLVEAALKGMDFTPFEPFELLVYDATAESFILRWDGLSAAVRRAGSKECPLASSSFVTRPVVQYRKEHFRNLMQGSSSPVKAQTSFHTERSHPDPAYNPRMMRAEARTVSITEVAVNKQAVLVSYTEVLPDGTLNTVKSDIQLPRTQTLRPSGF